MGQLASVPMTLSIAGGTRRTTQEMVTLDSTGNLPSNHQVQHNRNPIPALPAPPTAAAGVVAQTQMSLTASADMSTMSVGASASEPASPTSPARLPNAVTSGGEG